MMTKHIYKIGKIRKCKTCRHTKIFYKEADGNWRCETCARFLVEANPADFGEDEQYMARMGTGQR